MTKIVKTSMHLGQFSSWSY